MTCAVYVPKHFAPDDDAVQELLANHGAADLITMTADGLVATMLPFIYDRPRNVLLGHVARNNDHWQREAIGDALVIMRGPNAYVSPAWYASKQEHGRVVPTWNYVTAHVYGELVVYDAQSNALVAAGKIPLIPNAVGASGDGVLVLEGHRQLPTFVEFQNWVDQFMRDE